MDPPKPPPAFIESPPLPATSEISVAPIFMVPIPPPAPPLPARLPNVMPNPPSPAVRNTRFPEKGKEYSVNSPPAGAKEISLIAAPSTPKPAESEVYATSKFLSGLADARDCEDQVPG